MRYVISYDLIKPGKNYSALTQELQSLGAHKILLSQWVVIRYNTTARDLAVHLWKFMDNNDRLLVTELDGGNWASYNLLVDLNTV